MEIKKCTDTIYYLPHQAEVDRPMLAYVKGSKFSLAIDAGYSANHVDDFYRQLEKAELKKPDFTVITHWHYDHTFGMHHIQGTSIAHARTNLYLKAQQEKALNPSYIKTLKQEDPCFAREYHDRTKLHIVLSNIALQQELRLNLGGITAQVFHTESPHSEDCVCIYIPEEKVLFLGDATSEDFFNNGYMDKCKLGKLVDRIEKTDCMYCFLSHAEPLKKEDLLVYLNHLLEN